MDILRSAYSTQMQFWNDETRPPIPVTWFFCEEGAKAYPHYHRFGSGNWASDKKDWTGPGEVEYLPRPWEDGQQPGPDKLQVAIAQPYETSGVWQHGYVSVQQFVSRPHSSLIAWIWTFNNTGLGLITQLTDTAGNTWVQDHREEYPEIDYVALEVWRCADALPKSDARLTIIFPGSQLFLTFGILTVRNLRHEHPTVIKGNSGEAPLEPSTGSFDTKSFQQLVLLNLQTYPLTKINTIPPGFTNVANVSDNPSLYPQGNVAYKVIPKHARLDPKWQVDWDDYWVCAALVYDAVKRPRHKGDHFCGPKEYFRDGAPVDAEPLGADRFGVAPCCKFPMYLGCSDITPWGILEITAIYDHGATTTSAPGMRFTLFQGSDAWDLPNAEFMLKVGVIGGITGYCDDDVMTVLVPAEGPDEIECDSQRMFPPGVKWSYIKVIQGSPGNDKERWDFVVRFYQGPQPPTW